MVTHGQTCSTPASHAGWIFTWSWTTCPRTPHPQIISDSATATAAAGTCISAPRPVHGRTSPSAGSHHPGRSLQHRPKPFTGNTTAEDITTTIQPGRTTLHRIPELETDINNWIEHWNTDPRPLCG
jgi:hypothetical protein